MVYLIENEPGARIKVIGAGGCGGNAINHMIVSGLGNVEFVSVNTDSQALRNNSASIQLQIGQMLTRGRGAGGNPEIGRRAALEDEERLRNLLAESEMVFVTAGMGGGTGTGSAPVIARLARELGALTVGVVTKPFLFEGRKRRSQADEGLRELKEAVDTLITIPNDRLLSVASRTTTLKEAFHKADDVLLQAVRGISELVTVPGLINLDFADVRSIMASMGMAMMGMACASGEDRAIEAAQRAISSPLLEDTSIKGARGLLINVTGGLDMSLFEVHEAASLVQDEAHEDANIIFGAVIDEQLRDEIRVTVIATGFGEARREPERRTPGFSPAEFQSTVPPRNVPGPQFEQQPSIATEVDAARPEIALQAERDVSSDIASPSVVESQPVRTGALPEASPVQAPLHNGMFNGNGKKIRRLGLVDDKVLDLATVKQGKTERPVYEACRNGISKLGDGESEHDLGDSEHQLAESDQSGEVVEPEQLADGVIDDKPDSVAAVSRDSERNSTNSDDTPPKFPISPDSLPPLLELERTGNASLAESVPPQAAQTFSFNSNSKPVAPLELIKQGILTLANFKRRAAAIQITNNERNGPSPSRSVPSRSCMCCGATELSEGAAFCSKCGASLRG